LETTNWWSNDGSLQYIGLHPWVFKNSASKAIEYVQTAKSVASTLGLFGGSASKHTSRSTTPAPLQIGPPAASPSSTKSWSSFLTPAAGFSVGGVLLATAAAGTAYVHREDIGSGVTLAQSHLKYVGNLWDEKKLAERVEALMKLSKDSSEGGEGIVFRNFYTLISPKPPSHPEPRTFIILPKPRPESGSKMNAANYFLAATNTLAEDETAAHTGMFSPQTNDGYYQLGLGVVEIVRHALREEPLSEAVAEKVVEKDRGTQESKKAPLAQSDSDKGVAEAKKSDGSDLIQL